MATPHHPPPPKKKKKPWDRGQQSVIIIQQKHKPSRTRKKNSYPRECIFSKMDIASMAIHATISVDILKLTYCLNNTIHDSKKD